MYIFFYYFILHLFTELFIFEMFQFPYHMKIFIHILHQQRTIGLASFLVRRFACNIGAMVDAS